MTKSLKTHKENLHFFDGSLILVEDGYKLLKIVNKNNKKYGVWGFKVKIKITSDAKLKSHLDTRQIRIAYSLFDEDGFHIADVESGRLSLPFLPEDHIKRDNETSSNTYNLDEWEDATEEGQYMTYNPDEWEDVLPVEMMEVEELEEEESGFIEYINQGTIDFEDIKRVRKREINIYGYDR